MDHPGGFARGGGVDRGLGRVRLLRRELRLLQQDLRQLRQRRNGGEWLRLVVCDRSGSIEAVAWEAVSDAFEVAVPGAAVHVGGRFGVHPQYGPKITIEAIRAARPEEFEAGEAAGGARGPGGR